MSKVFARPKKFGEILDLTFQICKQHFSSLFMILLILIGPLYLLQILIQIVNGASFFRNEVTGSSFFEQITNIYDQAYLEASNEALPLFSFGEIAGGLLMILLSVIIYPVAFAAIILLVKRIKDQDTYTVQTIIKQAFSRFWPLLWSALLIGIITVSIFIATFMLAGFVGTIMVIINPILGALAIFALLVAGMFGFGLLITRWSFYLPALLFDRIAPGLTKSWKLTRGRSWLTFWLYVTLGVILVSASAAVEFIPLMILGQSVVYTIIISLTAIITWLVFMVGYAVMYFDLEVRQSGDDLKDLIADYSDTNNDQGTIME